jgi:glycerol-3-phosphate dehydrogenase
MAEDMIDRAEKVNEWKKTTSVTRKLKLRGSTDNADYGDLLHVYGSDREKILGLIKNDPVLGESLSNSLPILKAQIIWAIREEMAMTVEDVLSRRTRCQLLDARESLRIAPDVAEIMAVEMEKDEQWINAQIAAYYEVTKNYFPAEPGIKKTLIKI